ncbi:MAG: hypothetical protein O2800_01535 [Planctomycetota bacterium]|nr:hypothetical protein [Planctomycetota bacterium]
MKTENEPREKLAQLVSLAKVYRGWNRHQMAGALNREASKMVPASGNPKLDLVFALSEALDWTVGEVAEILRPGRLAGQDARTIQELDGEAIEAHRIGNWKAMEHLAELMASRAETGRERALAANRLAGAFDGQGRYTRSLAAVQAGLSEQGVPSNLRTMLQVNLANAHAMLWHLLEARSVASDLVTRFAEFAPEGRFDRVAQAFAYSIRGNAGRRCIQQDPQSGESHARGAMIDLDTAASLYTELARDFDDSSYIAIANTCRGGTLECESMLGLVDHDIALAKISAALEAVVDPSSVSGDQLESYGWWCVYGCNIALRHLSADECQRAIAVYANKSAEIAETLDNWSLRERTFTMDWMRRMESGTVSEDWVLDDEDIRIIAGTMGRFPHFRETGWKILEQAGVLGSEVEGGTQ